jgi:hypothetical protein
MNVVHLYTVINIIMKVYEIISEVTAPPPSRMGRNLKVMIATTLRRIGPADGASVTGFIPKALLKYIVIVKWLGFWDFAVEYYNQWRAIDALRKSGEIDDSDASAAKRIAAEEMVAKIIVSNKFGSFLRWILRLTVIGRVGSKIIGIGAAGATLGLLGGPAALEILATEAAAIWLEKYLKSDEGKNVIANCVMYAIDPTLTWLWNQGPGAWSKSLHANSLSDKGEEKLKPALGNTGDITPPALRDKDSKDDVDSTSDSGYLDKAKRLAGTLVDKAANSFNPWDAKKSSSAGGGYFMDPGNG